MKQYLILIFAAFATALLLSNTFKKEEVKALTPECYISCFNIETREMIQLDASKPGFAALHEIPKQFILENPVGEMISFDSPDGKNASAYFIKSVKIEKKRKEIFLKRNLKKILRCIAEYYFILSFKKTMAFLKASSVNSLLKLGLDGFANP